MDRGGAIYILPVNMKRLFIIQINECFLCMHCCISMCQGTDTASYEVAKKVKGGIGKLEMLWGCTKDTNMTHTRCLQKICGSIFVYCSRYSYYITAGE